MAWTQADLDALKAARARGVRKVKQGQEEVEFRDDSEMAALQREMEASLGLTSGSRVSYPKTNLGWR